MPKKIIRLVVNVADNIIIVSDKYGDVYTAKIDSLVKNESDYQFKFATNNMAVCRNLNVADFSDNQKCLILGDSYYKIKLYNL